MLEINFYLYYIACLVPAIVVFGLAKQYVPSINSLLLVVLSVGTFALFVGVGMIIDSIPLEPGLRIY